MTALDLAFAAFLATIWTWAAYVFAVEWARERRARAAAIAADTWRRHEAERRLDDWQAHVTAAFLLAMGDPFHETRTQIAALETTEESK